MSATAEAMGAGRFVVTAFGGRPETGTGSRLVLGSGVWNGATPYRLGYPLRWVLERTGDGVRLRRVGSRADEVLEGPVREIGEAELAGERPIEVEPGGSLWITLRPVLGLGPSAQPGVGPTWAPEPLPAGPAADPAAERILRLAAVGVVAACLCLLGLIRLIPVSKPDPTELVPPQYAKLLLSPVVKTPADRKRGSGSDRAVGNVLQALRSEAVQRTARKLLNPSAIKGLLSRSSLERAGANRQVVRNVFESKSRLSPKTGLGNIALEGMDRGLPPVDSQGRETYRGAAATSTAAQEGGLADLSLEGLGVAEGLSKEEVGKVIRDHRGEIRYCYEAALARNPSLEGKLLVAFTVGTSGAVKDAKTVESSGDPLLDRCIQTRLMKWAFPKPREGVDVGVTYPFIFKSLGG